MPWILLSLVTKYCDWKLVSAPLGRRAGCNAEELEQRTAGCCLQQCSHMVSGTSFSTFSFMLTYNLTLGNIFKIFESLKFHVYLMIKLIYTDLGKKKILCRSNHTTKNDLCNCLLPSPSIRLCILFKNETSCKKKNGTFNPPSTPPKEKYFKHWDFHIWWKGGSGARTLY